MRPQDRSDLTLINKPDPKMVSCPLAFNINSSKDLDNFNDIFMNNFLRNPGSYPDLFPPGHNPQNLSFDPNLLYNFPGMSTSTKSGQNAAQNDPLNQNNLLFQNMNNNFLLQNFPLGNSNLYDDLLKNPNPNQLNQLNQLDLPDKNIFNPGMMQENQGLIGTLLPCIVPYSYLDNQFLLPGMDEFNFKQQDVGQGPK